MQPSLMDTMPPFDGPELQPADHGRLTGQLARVIDLMADGRWRTLAQITCLVGGSEAGISARLRDARKSRFGAWTVEKRRIGNGLFSYRVTR